MNRQHWLTLPMGSEEINVYLVTDDDPGIASDNDEEGPLEGCTIDGTTILIRRSLSRTRWPGILVHELTHAASHVSGLSVTMRWRLSTEERVVHALAPMLAHALVGGGLWKFPRVPK
jgi:hypothetical protein